MSSTLTWIQATYCYNHVWQTLKFFGSRPHAVSDPFGDAFQGSRCLKNLTTDSSAIDYYFMQPDFAGEAAVDQEDKMGGVSPRKEPEVEKKQKTGVGVCRRKG
ncbi:hypothetical protein F2Q68_00008370 [Brassica cretica]|uniref:Uncharacterized protein n=1 Tax=Brassica cretica TaxID=69181 RepID=A0A8S9KTD0_BRACR|nr:hypothetical protein F2Q68_00008370 [Brassica cretica]